MKKTLIASGTSATSRSHVEANKLLPNQVHARACYFKPDQHRVMLLRRQASALLRRIG